MNLLIDSLDKQKGVQSLVKHTIAMFTIPVFMYYLFSRKQTLKIGLIFRSLEDQHTRQTLGVIGAVIGVFAVKIHYLYQVFTDPTSFQPETYEDDEPIPQPKATKPEITPSPSKKER